MLRLSGVGSIFLRPASARPYAIFGHFLAFFFSFSTIFWRGYEAI